MSLPPSKRFKVEETPTKICEVVGKGLIKWRFGVGEEGIKEMELSRTGVVIVDDIYPCWFPAAKAVGLKVLAIWLTNDENPLLSRLVNWVGDIPIALGGTFNEVTQKALGQCSTVLIGGVLPDVFLETKVLHLSNIVSVIATSTFNIMMPVGWHSSSHKVFHADVGGVTDGCFVFNVHSRTGNVESVHLESTPRQDLRSIMKSGESGVLNYNLCSLEAQEAAREVRFCGRGIVEHRSLLPSQHPNIQVRTQWRGHLWIHRRMTIFERLLSMDVPEKLIRLTADDSLRTCLLKNVHVPNKALHSFLHSFLNNASQQHEPPIKNRKRKRVSLSVDGNTKEGFDVPKAKFNRMNDTVADMNSQKRQGFWSPSLPSIHEEEFGLADVDMIAGELETVSTSQNLKATKRDDALAQVDLWNSYLLKGISCRLSMEIVQPAAETLRWWMMSLWRRRVFRSYIKWREQSDCFSEFDADAADCIRRVANATWWNWDQGSRPLFWKWPEDYWKRVLHGVPAWFGGRVTPWIRRQGEVDDLNHVKLIRQKLDTIQQKGYVEDGPITSLMPFFHVPKGIDDIRMVYDGSASGLNDMLWAPWFSLPTVATLIRSLEPGYSMSDNDLGEMFHNFMLDAELRKYCGMDITRYGEEDPLLSHRSKKRWVRWNRLAMGLRPSPYCAVQGIMMAREIILGNQWDELNVFRWERTRLNLPGMSSYNPSKSWFSKVRQDGTVAADMFVYVDDIRCSAPTKAEAWLAAQRTSSVLASLGLQDASRKRRPPGEETGAWTGAVVWTSNNGIVVMTTQEKWDKAKLQLQWIADNIDNTNGMDHKTLERIRGFMVYVSQTYPSLVPYLKGLHATIDSWRYGRTRSGFKMSPNNISTDHELDAVKWEDKLGMTKLSKSQPATVMPVERFRNDLICLQTLTSEASPPHRLVRMSDQVKVIYGFGDASKHGFGASIELSTKQLYWRFGQWRLDEEVSSNYRELRNLVEALEGAFEKGFLKDREVFMFTDNTTAESAFCKGMSKSELLFDLVLRLRKIEMSGQCVIHVIHVAGTRMINQGTDGLSRGDKTSGVMAGENMISFVPLHLNAQDRSPDITAWIEGICQGEPGTRRSVKFLTPDDWVCRLGDRIHYVWMPPPAVADVAVECLAQAIHKRSNALHIFICPRLMTARWNKTIQKASDLSITIPIGTVFWSKDQHEPLMFCVAFPLSTNRPWKHGGTPHIEHIGKNVPGMFQDNLAGASSMLRECFSRAWRMAAV